MLLETKIKNLCSKKNITLSVAESCSGGLISHLITNISGSSYYFKGGVFAYSNQVKIKILKIQKNILKKYGAVSCVTAQKMATKIRKIINTDIGFSITGIAGPKGGSITKPVGTVFLGLATKKKTFIFHKKLNGTREQIKKNIAKITLKILINYISNYK